MFVRPVRISFLHFLGADPEGVQRKWRQGGDLLIADNKTGIARELYFQRKAGCRLAVGVDLKIEETVQTGIGQGKQRTEKSSGQLLEMALCRYCPVTPVGRFHQAHVSGKGGVFRLSLRDFAGELHCIAFLQPVSIQCAKRERITHTFQFQRNGAVFHADFFQLDRRKMGGGFRLLGKCRAQLRLIYLDPRFFQNDFVNEDLAVEKFPELRAQTQAVHLKMLDPVRGGGSALEVVADQFRQW